jgi:steroid delta-isomerase-like uncharacterized protein
MRKFVFVLVALAFMASSLPAAAGIAEDKATAARVFVEKMGEGRFEIASEIYGPGFIAHGFGRDYTLAEDDASGRMLREAFPDLKVSVDRIIAEDDLVAVHWRSSGTNTVKVGMFPGEGKSVALDGMTFFRFEDGRIVEEWSAYDNLGMMQALGLLPAQ